MMAMGVFVLIHIMKMLFAFLLNIVSIFRGFLFSVNDLTTSGSIRALNERNAVYTIEEWPNCGPHVNFVIFFTNDFLLFIFLEKKTRCH